LSCIRCPTRELWADLSTPAASCYASKTELNKSLLNHPFAAAASLCGLFLATRIMTSAERVISALNFLTGEGVNNCPDDCDASNIEALITDYFNEGPGDDESDDEAATGMKVNCK